MTNIDQPEENLAAIEGNQEVPSEPDPDTNVTVDTPLPTRKRGKRRVSPIVTGIVGLVVGALAVGIPWIVTSVLEKSTSPDKELLAAAYEVCGPSEGIELRDDNSTLIFDNKGKEDTSGADIADIACIFGMLDVPSNVTSHMDQTTSMDGRQVERWGNYEVQWSYHPSRGMDGTLTVIEEK